jgi:hypothetical protein
MRRRRPSTIDVEPTDAERAEAQKLFDAGWLPISNQHRLVGWASPTVDIPAALKTLSPHVDPTRWKGNVADLRDSLARSGISEELEPGTYAALKQLCGANNRGRDDANRS